MRLFKKYNAVGNLGNGRKVLGTVIPTITDENLYLEFRPDKGYEDKFMPKSVNLAFYGDVRIGIGKFNSAKKCWDAKMSAIAKKLDHIMVTNKVSESKTKLTLNPWAE